MNRTSSHRRWFRIGLPGLLRRGPPAFQTPAPGPFPRGRGTSSSTITKTTFVFSPGFFAPPIFEVKGPFAWCSRKASRLYSSCVLSCLESQGKGQTARPGHLSFRLLRASPKPRLPRRCTIACKQMQTVSKHTTVFQEFCLQF